MKEILFRGKRIDNGEWVDGYYYESKISGCFILPHKIKVREKDGVVIKDSCNNSHYKLLKCEYVL